MRYFLIILILVPWMARAVQLSWYGPDDLNLTGQACWLRATNSNYGANYQISTVMSPSPPSTCANYAPVDFIVRTNAANPVINPGVYKSWMKILTYPASYQQQTLSINDGPYNNLGGASVEGNIWKYLGLVTITNAASSIKFSMMRTNLARAYYAELYAIYMNTDTNVTVVSASDTVQTWNLPTTTNTSPAYPGNIVNNSGFELPHPAGPWSVGRNGTRYWSSMETLSSELPYEGKSCLRLDFSLCTTNYKAGMIVDSRPVRLRPDRAHSLSVWAKATAAGATLQMALRNAVVLPGTETNIAPQPAYQTGNQALTTNWTRYFLQNQVLWQYPYCEYSPQFTVQSVNGGQVYLDAVQFEEGTNSTTYADLPWTIGFEIPQLGNLLYPDDTVNVRSIIHNASGTNRTATIDWNLYYRGYELVQTGSVVNVTSSGGYYTNSLGLMSTLPRGFYRLTSQLRDDEQIQAEASFTLAPYPSKKDGPLSNNVIGYHGFHYHYSQQQHVDRAGLKRWRSLSPGAFFRFSAAHPSTNEYVWFDRELNSIQQYDVEVLGVLELEFSANWITRAFLSTTNRVGTFQVGETYTTSGGGSGKITWVSQAEDTMFPFPCLQSMNATGSHVAGVTLTGSTSGATCTLINGMDNGTKAMHSPTFPLNEWGKFCSNIVAHYTNVTTWEMLNEPGPGNPQIANDGGMRFAAYCTREGVRGIRGVRSTDKIVSNAGHQGPQYATIHWDNIPIETRTNLFAQSWHLYCTTLDGRGAECKAWATARGLESWNTESGYEDGLSHLTVSDTRHYNGYAMQPFIDADRDISKFVRTPRIVSTNLVELLWTGMDRYYYYDMRQSADAVNDIYTPAGSHFSMMGMHDEYKAKMSSLLWMNDIYGGGDRRMILSNSYCRVFGMDGSTGPWVCLYSPRAVNVAANWGLLSTNVEAYSLEGKQLTIYDLGFQFSIEPIFIKGIGISAGILFAETTNAAFGIVGDGIPPVVLFKQAPVGNISQRRNEAGFVVSVIGCDVISTPYGATPHALQYRFSLNNVDWSTWSDTSLVPPGVLDPAIVRRHRDNEEALAFAPGTHTIYVQCRDESNNIGYAQRTFTIL